MRIGPAQKITVFLKNERRIELCGSGNDQLRSRSDGMRQQRTRSNCRKWLTRAAMCAVNIVSSNTSTTKTAIDRLHLDRLTAQCLRRHSIAHSARDQLL